MTRPDRHDAAQVVLNPAQPVIVVVDDEDHLRSILKVLLGQLGYHVLLAATGDEAIELYRRHLGGIHLVLLDVRLRGRSGLATLDALRALDSALRCCLMSGGQDDYTGEDLLRLGVLSVLRKPFRAPALVQLLGQLPARATLTEFVLASETDTHITRKPAVPS